MLNFDFLEKGLGIVSLPYFVYDFSREIFLMLYSINPICTRGVQICTPLWKITQCISNFAARTLCFNDF